MDGRCDKCGTLDQRGPHTLTNCRDVLAWKLAQAEEKSRVVPPDVALAVVALGRARRAHEDAVSDPSRNVSTGQALYAARQHLDRLLIDLVKGG